MTTGDVAAGSAGVTVADLLAVLEPAGLRQVCGPAGLVLSEPAVHDPLSPLPVVRGGLLLGVGIDPAADTAPSVVEQAAAHGFRAVLVKSRGAGLGPLATAADRAGVALLVVDDGVDWRALDSLVTSALSATGRTGSLSTPPVGDLFALANAVAAMVGGATAIEDVRQRVLAYSTLPDQPIDEDRRQGILGRQVPDLPVNAGQYRELFRATRPVRFRAAAPALARLAVAVRAGSELLGSIWVVDDGRLAPEAARGLERAAEIAALHLLRARSGEDLGRQQRGELLRQLLEHPEEPGSAVGRLGLDPDGPFAVLAFRPRPGPPGRSDDLALLRLVDLVALHCEAQQGRTGCVALGGTVYALVGSAAGTGPGRLAGLAGEIVSRAEVSLRTGLLAAVGTVVDDVAAISGSRRDADLVLRLLTERAHLRPVASAAALHSSLALVELAEVLADNPRLTSPAARRVLDHDRRRGSAYAVTLQAYLDHAQDAPAAAAALSVHPNTLRYRVRRAVELFGLDLADPDEVLALWLTLRTARRPVSGPRSPRRAGTP